MLTLMGALALGVAIIAFGHAAYTQWRQTRDTGPLAIVPTLPVAIAAPALGTWGLVLVAQQNEWAKLPGWGYLATWLIGTIAAVMLLRSLGRRA